MEYETYADVIDAYNADNMGYSTLTDYIKGQNIKIKEISMEPLADLQRSLFENKADGGMIGIEVLFRPKRDDFRVGGAAGREYGANTSVSRGVRTSPSRGPSRDDKDNRIQLAELSQKQLDFLNQPINQKSLKDSSFGLTPRQIFKKLPSYEEKPFFGPNQKPTTEEEFNEYLKSIGVTQLIKDGGRVGLFMGGDPLEGQALQIYNSMKGYNFSDQEIADALSARGLYTSGGGGGGSEQVSGIIGTQLNRVNDSVTSIAPGTLQKQYQANLNNPINNALYEMGAKFKASQPYQKTMNLGAMAMGALTGIPGLGFLLDKLGQPGFNRGNIREMNTPKTLDAKLYSDDSGINTDFKGVTVDDLGRIVQTGNYLTAENVMAGYNTGFDLTGTAFDRIDKITASAAKRGVPISTYNLQKIKALKDFAASATKSRKDALQKEIERAQRIKDEAARAAAVDRARVKSISEGYGGHDNRPGATGPTAAGAGMGVGGGYASDYQGADGGFVPTGLATMFTRRR